MDADEAKQALLNFLIDCKQERVITLKEERPPIDTPAHGWYMGFFDALEEMNSFIKELK